MNDLERMEEEALEGLRNKLIQAAEEGIIEKGEYASMTREEVLLQFEIRLLPLLTQELKKK
jgi:hypothetical protein